MRSAKAQQVLDLFRDVSVLRPRDVEALGIPREYLARLCRQGLVERVGRGLYALAEGAPILEHVSMELREQHGLYTQAEVTPTEYHSLVEVAKKVPHGVICLLSALSFHNLTTQSSFEVWIAIDIKARQPKYDGIPMRIVRFSRPALEAGVEKHIIEGVPVRVYNPPKTVADCFKYRHKIGLDVALEALRDCWRQGRCSVDDLWYYAKICRVANVMKPYLEMEAIA